MSVNFQKWIIGDPGSSEDFNIDKKIPRFVMRFQATDNHARNQRVEKLSSLINNNGIWFLVYKTCYYAKFCIKWKLINGEGVIKIPNQLTLKGRLFWVSRLGKYNYIRALQSKRRENQTDGSGRRAELNAAELEGKVGAKESRQFLETAKAKKLILP